VRKLLLAVIGAWIARWAALELASILVRRRPQGPPPLESARVPGVMPLRPSQNE
jgi:hypothetical protein